MNYSNLPPSSPEKRREDFKAKPVVNSPARVKKRSPLRHAADIIFSGDRTNIKEDIIDEIVLPSIRDLIYEALSRGLESIFFARGERRGSRNSNRSYISYNTYSDRDRRDDRRDRYRSSRDLGEDLEYDTYQEAFDVKEEMLEILQTFGAVTVADLYDASKRTPPGGFPNEYYGWVDLADCYISKYRGRYILHMPHPVELPRNY